MISAPELPSRQCNRADFDEMVEEPIFCSVGQLKRYSDHEPKLRLTAKQIASKYYTPFKNTHPHRAECCRRLEFEKYHFLILTSSVMAQPNQVTPTFQANVSGASTTVNLRDWLNTRLSPFLKKAIIESLDSE